MTATRTGDDDQQARGGAVQIDDVTESITISPEGAGSRIGLTPDRGVAATRTGRFDVKRAQKCLLGRGLEKADWLVLSPIKSLFDEVCGRFVNEFTLEERGFWKNVLLPPGTLSLPGSIMVVSTPQGFGGADAIYIEVASRVLFLGYAGGLSSHPIGSVVEVVETVTFDGRRLPLETTGIWPGVVSAWSPCLLGLDADRAIDRAIGAGAEAVEMEVGACVRAASQVGIPASAWLLITDRPHVLEFCDLGPGDQRRIEAGHRRIMEVLHGFA